MSNFKREVAINVIGSIVGTLLLLGLGNLVTRVSAEIGVHLNVAQRVENYGPVNVLFVRAENASRFGLSPVTMTVPNASAVRAAVVRTPTDSASLQPGPDTLRWTGDMAPGTSLDAIFVFDGPIPVLPVSTLFAANYTFIDPHGFSAVGAANVRLESEAVIARMWLAARWLGLVFAVSVFLILFRWAWILFGSKPDTPAEPAKSERHTPPSPAGGEDR